MKPMETGTVRGPPGKWVLVVRGEVIATNDDPEALFREAERFPKEETLVTKILYPRSSYYEGVQPAEAPGFGEGHGSHP